MQFKFLIRPLVLAALLLGACSSDDDDAAGQSLLTSDQQPAQFLGSSSTTAGTASNAVTGTPIGLAETAIGRVLVAGENNRTLYTFANDRVGVSNCEGNCASLWPPLMADANQQAGLDELRANSSVGSVGRGLGVIARTDTQLQWTLNGMPLYFYSGDAAAGETNGENIDGVWFVARPFPVELGDSANFNGPLLRGSGSINSGLDDPALRTSIFEGHTLYTFALDIGGFSDCNTGCVEDWPPLFADRGAVGADGFTVITRNSGAAQWAFNNQPLYFFIGDSQPGDVFGNGAGAVWFVATP